MSRTIAVALPKGGVGKTTTAVNLAASLAVAEKRTLLVDMDSFGASAMALGFLSGRIKSGLYEAYNFITSLQQTIHRTELQYLDFVPSNVQSLQMEDRILRLADNRSLLRNLLRGVAHQYDYVILDCPPVLRGLCTNALVAADSVLVPVKSGHFALEAVDRLFTYIQWLREVAHAAVVIEGIVFTMHEPHTRVTDITVRELQAKYRRYILKTTIPKNIALSEASFYGKPAVLHKLRSHGSTAYLALAREIIARHTDESEESSGPTMVHKFASQRPR
jgi:chromosome partitioning protein